jgi:riboflavin kinase/FMN adenylyltransferase
MYLARKDRSFPFSLVAEGSVATIGTFDGLHLGHQHLLQRVLSEAAERKLPAVVMSFEPTPKEFFSRGEPPGRLTRFREKFEMFDAMGFDIFYCPRFSEEMRNIAVGTFIRRLLIHAMNVQHLVVGDDFEFARNREGTLEELQRASRALDFSVEQVASIVADGERISSTVIRKLLRAGDLQGASRRLGMPYRMCGRVFSGTSEAGNDGKQLAFINLQRRQSPLTGIFAVMVHGLGDTPLNALAAVGKSQASGDSKPRIALRIFDSAELPNGQHIDVEFYEQISGDGNREDDVPLLKTMHRYESKAREILAAFE